MFPIAESNGPERSAPAGRPRVQRADRHQVAMRALALDGLLPEEHQARLVWEYVEGLDLASLYEPIRAVEGHAGRDAIDPRILMALWLYATLNGVGSARQLDRLCRDHVAYEWICGGVSVNYHTLSDFRTAHPEFLDELLTQSVATLMHQDLVTLHRVAQDGMRVRASAGAASFRRRQTLEQCQMEAQEQVESLRQELDGEPGGSSKRQQAARRRAARERSERVRRALEELPDVESKKKAGAKDKARVSTTDPEARVMKMADGGFRPAHNVQLATDTESQVITGVDVVNTGSDAQQSEPLRQQAQRRTGRKVKEHLLDGGFVNKELITAAESQGVAIYAPLPKNRQGEPCTYDRQDSAGVAAWRRRMTTPAAQTLYQQRAATAETVNGETRAYRGLGAFLVRGLRKVRCVALWAALAYNLVHFGEQLMPT